MVVDEQEAAKPLLRFRWAQFSVVFIDGLATTVGGTHIKWSHLTDGKGLAALQQRVMTA